MPDDGSRWADLIGLVLVLALVLANGFFVAAEFALVAIRPSRVAELVTNRRRNAGALQRAIQQLDANLAATQLGITISSLALGWVGEPAIAHLIEPLLSMLPPSLAIAGSHAVAVVISFVIITTLHIVLGELAPKSLALQRSESTALWVVRPLGFFLVVLRPAIIGLNGLGNLVLRLLGLQPGNAEHSLHSPDELKLLVAASKKAGLLQAAQQEVVERVLNIGDRPVAEIMTPRGDVTWIDLDDPPAAQLETVRQCRHDQLLVARGSIDEPLGMLVKHDLLDQMLDGAPLDVQALLREPIAVHEATQIFRMLEHFKKTPLRLALVVDEYGSLEGIVTQTDLLAALAGDLPGVEGAQPNIVTQTDGSFVLDGMTPIHEALNRLGLRLDGDDDFNTIAGFALSQLGHLPVVGEAFVRDGWRFEILAMDGRRIDRLHARRLDL